MHYDWNHISVCCVFSSIAHRQDALVDVLLSRGVPTSQLVLTVPSYGYKYDLQQAHVTSPGSLALQGPIQLTRKEVWDVVAVPR